jgi:DNA primase
MMFSRLEELVRHRVDDSIAGRSGRAVKTPPGAPPATQRTAMRLALAHLVQNPSLASGVQDMEAFAGCDLPGFEIYRELVDFCSKSPNMTTAQLLELWHDRPAQSHLRKLATWDLHGDEENLAREFRDTVVGLELQWVESRIERMPKIVDLGPEERQQLLTLQQRRQQLIGEIQGGEP